MRCWCLLWMLIGCHRLFAQDTTDVDQDGLPDRLEDSVANLHAPSLVYFLF